MLQELECIIFAWDWVWMCVDSTGIGEQLNLFWKTTMIINLLRPLCPQLCSFYSLKGRAD